MAMLVSTPAWREQPDDQENRWRHFVPSFQRHLRSHFVQLSTAMPRTGEAERLRTSDSGWSIPSVIGTSCARGLSTTSTTF